MKRKILAMALVAFGASSAIAQSGDAESEMFWQPDSGQSELTATFGYSSLATRTKGTTTDSKLSGINPLSVQYMYGISDSLAIGGAIGYQNMESDGTPKTKVGGITDPVVRLDGTTQMAFGNLQWGADLVLGFMKAKREIKSDGGIELSSTDPLAFTSGGGISLIPYVGVDTQAGPGILGGKLSFELGMEHDVELKTSGGTTDLKSKGGDAITLTGFYEYMLSDMILGGALNYVMISEETLKGTGVDSTTKAFSPIGIDLYGRIPAGGFAVIPKLAYYFTAGGDEFDKYSNMNLSLAGRWSF